MDTLTFIDKCLIGYFAATSLFYLATLFSAPLKALTLHGKHTHTNPHAFGLISKWKVLTWVYSCALGFQGYLFYQMISCVSNKKKSPFINHFSANGPDYNQTIGEDGSYSHEAQAYAGKRIQNRISHLLYCSLQHRHGCQNSGKFVSSATRGIKISHGRGNSKSLLLLCSSPDFLHKFTLCSDSPSRQVTKLINNFLFKLLMSE